MTGHGERRGPLEAVDIGVIFRLLPGLLPAGAQLTGRVDLTVIDGRDGDETTIYSIVLDDGIVRLSQSTAPSRTIRADAPTPRASGTASAGSRNRAPVPSSVRCELSGRHELVTVILQTLSPGELREPAAVAKPPGTRPDRHRLTATG